MELEHILEFAVLSDCLNYHRAADELFISQSSLSKHIKTLERDLGVPLFERNVSGVLLTDFGRIFAPYAKQMARLESAYREEILHKLNSLDGSVNLGTEYDISGLLCTFKQENPDFVVNLYDSPDTTHVKRGLRVGDFELAIMHREEETEAEFNSIPFCTEELVLAVSAKDPLGRAGKPVSLSALKDRRFIRPPEHGMLNQIIHQCCAAAGLEPVTVCTGLSTGPTLNLVAAEVGVALLPKLDAQLHGDPGVALLSLDKPYPIHLNLYFRKNAELSPGAMKFISFMQKNRK